uniref:Uncharacterized protein n=1 Tax=viral metagenome TaxID=1070528 RepID=A0A6C0BQH8_9ZZZZ
MSSHGLEEIDKCTMINIIQQYLRTQFKKSLEGTAC